MHDVNWLYSTMVTCATAVIAIVGGYIFSRILEKKRQGEELDVRTFLLDSERQEIEASIFDLQLKKIEEHKRQVTKRIYNFISGNGLELKDEDILDDPDVKDSGLDHAEILGIWNNIKLKAENARGQLKKKLGAHEIPRISAEQLDVLGISYGEDELPIYLAVLQEIRKAKSLNTKMFTTQFESYVKQFQQLSQVGMSSIALSSLAQPAQGVVRQKYEQQLRDLMRSQDRLLAEQRVRDVPDNFRYLFWSLGLIFATGILMPIVVMTRVPIWDSAGWRDGLLGAQALSYASVVGASWLSLKRRTLNEDIKEANH